MRKSVLLIMVLWLFSGLRVSAESATDYSKVYVFGGDEHFPPYEFVVDSDGAKAYRGFNVDIIKAIALQTGIEIELRPLPWAEALKALERGELDAIQGMKYTNERAYRYDFSDEYITSSQIIFVRKDTYIADMADLKGHDIAVQEGDIAYQKLSKDPSYNLVLVSNQEEAFTLLLAGTVTAVIGNKLAGQYILQKNKQVDLVKMVGPEIDPYSYGVAVRKDNQGLLRLINKGLRDIKKNGTYDTIYKKWFGEPVDYPVVYYKDRLTAALAGLGVVLAVLAFMLYLSYVLRREVHKRTHEIQAMNRLLLERNDYIRKENSYKEKILNSGYSGIVTLNCQGYIQFCNEYAARYFKKQNIVGAHFAHTFLKELLPEQLEEAVRGIEALTGEQVVQGAHLEYRCCVLATDRQTEGLVLNFRDITMEKQMQQQIVRKDKMESLGNLVAGIAHEIRTPLTSIKTFAELLPLKYESSTFREKISLYVPQEVTRINALVNDLLDYARPRPPFLEKLNFKILLSNILGLFSNHFEQGKIKVTQQVSDDIIVYADKQQLQQVIINILLNAVEALAEIRDPEIGIDCRQDNAYVTIAVEDNGKGIGKEHIEKIFDPFFTTKPNGTGLGLSISYQFITEIGGRVWAESLPGEGVKINIQLPKVK